MSRANHSLQAIIELIIEGNTKNLLNGHLKMAAVATCANSENNAVVIYTAENVISNAAAKKRVATLKAIRVPINEAAGSAENAIVRLKEELLDLVRQERMARLNRNTANFHEFGEAIKITIGKIKQEERNLVQARLDAEAANQAANVVEQQISVMNGKIEIAKGDLAVAVAKHMRLSRAKNILMARGGQEMTPSEEREFA